MNTKTVYNYYLKIFLDKHSYENFINEHKPDVVFLAHEDGLIKLFYKEVTQWK